MKTDNAQRPEYLPSTVSAVPGSPPRRRQGFWRSAAKVVASVLLLVLCLGLGAWAGPGLQSAYKRFFPAPEYVTGNYEAIYRQAGRPVVMFSKSTCPFCLRARALLEREKVDFEEVIVDESLEAKQRFEAVQGGAVPLLFIADRRIVGFREQTIHESLALLRK